MKTIEELFRISKDIRYVAWYENGELHSEQREDFVDASAAESDKYEELFINPSIVTLAKQRGNLDCGGLDHVLIRYGNFYQLLIPLSHGHASVCIAKEADPLSIVSDVVSALERHG